MAVNYASRVAVLALAVVLGGCESTAPGARPSGTPTPTSVISRAVSDPPQTTSLSVADYAAMKRSIERRLDAGGPELKAIEAVLVSIGDPTQVAVYRDRQPTDHAHVYSATKSVLSILIGMAVDDGKLRLDQTLGDSLPTYRDRMDDDLAGVTLQQLITMTAGLPGNGDDAFGLASPDLVGQTLSIGLSATPGESFTYSNAGAHLLGAVLAAAVGQTPLQYARSKLFDPLGIDSLPAYEGSDYFSSEFHAADFAWAADGSGLNSGAGGLKLTADDMIKIGQLYRAGGRWDGRQLVSAEWVAASTTEKVETGDAQAAHYGYLWWLAEVDGQRSFVASGSSVEGSAGQMILVVPERDLVVVLSCSDTDKTPRCWDAGWDLVWELVINPLR